MQATEHVIAAWTTWAWIGRAEMQIQNRSQVRIMSRKYLWQNSLRLIDAKIALYEYPDCRSRAWLGLRVCPRLFLRCRWRLAIIEISGSIQKRLREITPQY